MAEQQKAEDGWDEEDPLNVNQESKSPNEVNYVVAQDIQLEWEVLINDILIPGLPRQDLPALLHIEEGSLCVYDMAQLLVMDRLGLDQVPMGEGSSSEQFDDDVS